jgi:hypothetical protein
MKREMGLKYGSCISICFSISTCDSEWRERTMDGALIFRLGRTYDHSHALDAVIINQRLAFVKIYYLARVIRTAARQPPAIERESRRFVSPFPENIMQPWAEHVANHKWRAFARHLLR